MKKIITTLTLLLIIIIGESLVQLPNTHWVNNISISSAIFHLKFEGYYNNSYNYYIENKKSCNGDFAIYGISNIVDTVNIKATKVKHFSTIAPFNNDTIFVKALTNCSPDYDTCYWGVTTLAALPITEGSLSVYENTRLGNNNYVAEFDAYNVESNEYYTVEYKLLNSDEDWKQVTIFFPEDIKQTQHIKIPFTIHN